MKKLALSMILISASPLALAANTAVNPGNQLYPNTLGPQHIQNKALYKNQDVNNSQDGFNVSSNMLNMKGPLSVSMDVSSEYGVIMTGQYTQAIGQSNAASLQADLGKEERRLNGTWGVVLTNRQRLKLSAEYLEQYMDFNFLSGDLHKWVGQQAYGGTYEYLLQNRFIQDVNLNSTYSTVKSKNLSDKTMPNNPSLINVRRIAGGTDKSFSTGMDFTPFSTTTLGVALDYDKLNYDIKYHNQYQQAKNTQGFGATLNLSQLITKHVKVQLGASDRKPYDSYNGEIDYLAHTHPGSQLTFGLSTTRTISSAGLPNDTRLALKMSYAWGGNADAHPATYQVNENQNKVDAHNGLASWTADPAVYRAQVLAVADQKLETLNGQSAQNNLLSANSIIAPVDANNKAENANVSGMLPNQILNKGMALKGKILSTLPLHSTTKQNGLFADSSTKNNNTLSLDLTKSGYSTSKTAKLFPLKNIGLTLAENTSDQLTLSGIPTTAGTFYVKVYAKDTVGSSDTYAQTFTINVSNKAPSFTKDTITSSTTAAVNVPYSLDLASSDYVNDPVGLTKDKDIQLVPTSVDSTWTKYGFAASAKGSVKVTGTPTAAALSSAKDGEITLTAKIKNNYGESANATKIIIPISKAPQPTFTSKTITVAPATEFQSYTVNMAQYINDPVNKDATIQLVPVDSATSSKEDDKAWTGKNYTLKPGDVGKTTITGSINQESTVTLYALVKNQYSKNMAPQIATITIPVTKTPKPKNIQEDGHVNQTFKSVNISSDFAKNFPKGATLKFTNTKFMCTLGCAQAKSSSTFDITVDSQGEVSTSKTLQTSDQGQWTSTVTASDGTTSVPATLVVNVENDPSWKTIPDVNVTDGSTSFSSIDLSQYLAKGYEIIHPTAEASYSAKSGLPTTSNLSITKDGQLSLVSGKSIDWPAGTYQVTVEASIGSLAATKVDQTFNINVASAAPTPKSASATDTTPIVEGGTTSFDLSQLFNGTTAGKTTYKSDDAFIITHSNLVVDKNGLHTNGSKNDLPGGPTKFLGNFYHINIQSSNDGKNWSKPVDLMVDTIAPAAAKQVNYSITNNTKQTIYISGNSMINASSNIPLTDTAIQPGQTLPYLQITANNLSSDEEKGKTDANYNHHIEINFYSNTDPDHTYGVPLYAPLNIESCSGGANICPVSFAPLTTSPPTVKEITDWSKLGSPVTVQITSSGQTNNVANISISGTL